jgi:hypothetical protein
MFNFMKIDLGNYATSKNARVMAWIEPNFPAYRKSLDRVCDNGFLCVRVGERSPLELKLESTSEDRWKLVSCVGAATASTLIGIHKKYAQKPFYMAFDHHMYGRLYFEPTRDAETITLSTYSQDPGSEQHLTVRTHEELAAFMTLSHIRALAKWMPSDMDLTRAVNQGKQDANNVLAASKALCECIDWDFECGNMMIERRDPGKSHAQSEDTKPIEHYDFSP